MRISDWSSDVCSSDLRPSPTRCWTSLKRMRRVTRFGSAGGGIALSVMTTSNGRREDIPQQGILALEFVDMISEEPGHRSEEHTSELQSLMRTSYAVFCLKKKEKQIIDKNICTQIKRHN